MRKIVLAAEKMTALPKVHKYLQKTLGLPAHYGANLDALHDCLTELDEETELTVSAKVAQTEFLGWYGQQLLQVLQDAAEENDKLLIKIVD